MVRLSNYSSRSMVVARPWTSSYKMDAFFKYRELAPLQGTNNLLPTIADFEQYTWEGMSNSRQVFVEAFKICYLTAKTRRLHGGYMSWTRTATIGAFRVVPFETLWIEKNRNSVLLSLSTIVWQIKNINFFPTGTMNDARGEGELKDLGAGFSFKTVDMRRAKIIALLLDS